MNRTTLTLTDDLLRRVKGKAASEGVSVSAVVRSLLARWLEGKVDLKERREAEPTVASKALASFGIWRDRDPDEVLREVRSGWSERDQKLRDAGLDLDCKCRSKK